MVPDRESIVQWVRSFVGLSAVHDPNGELARLVDFPGGAPPEHFAGSAQAAA